MQHPRPVVHAYRHVGTLLRRLERARAAAYHFFSGDYCAYLSLLRCDPPNPLTTTKGEVQRFDTDIYKLSWRASLILVTCAGILKRDVEAFSQV